MVLSLPAASRRRLAMTTVTAIVALSASATGRAWAGVDRWTEIGQEGGSLSTVAIDPGDPSRLYAAGTSGAFVSSDRGERWHRLRGGLALGPVSLLRTVDGAPGLLYAVQGGLRRSTDGGLSWQPVPAAPAGTYYDLATVSSEPVTLFSLIFEPGGVDPALFRSRDGGEQWQRLFERVDCFACGVELDPFDPSIVYLWSREGVLRSGDGGDTWTALPDDPRMAEERILDLALAPSVEGSLYALINAPDRARLRVSRDAGGHWSEPGPLPFVRCQRLALHSGDDVAFLSCGDGITYRSDDGGASWAPALGLGNCSAIATDPADGSRLHAVYRSGAGVFSSADGGLHWRPAGRGIRAAYTPVRSAPSDPLTLYSADDCYLLLSEDGGESWERRGGPAGCTTRVVVEAVAIGSRHTLYVSVPAAEYSLTAPLYRSRDAGRSWTLLGPFPGGLLTPHPSDPEILLAGKLGIHRSDDGGATWREVLAGRAGGVGRIPLNIFFGAGEPPEAFATVEHSITGSSDSYLWSSHDSGETWEIGDSRTLLAVVPGEPSELYNLPAFSAPYEVSLDGGLTWQELNVLGEGLVVVPTRPPVLYTGGAETALVSHDRGESWNPVPGWTELKPSRLFGDHIGHPLAPGTLIAPTSGGLFRATFADAEPLALHGGRIEVRSAWRDDEGRLGAGRPRPISGESGAFWFFRPGNLELAVKALDGRPLNGGFWGFAAPLTTLEHEITLLDTATGRDVSWQNRAGKPRSRADLGGLVELLLPSAAASPAAASSIAPVGAAGGSCGGPGLCLLGDRFRVTVAWEDAAGGSGSGEPVPLTASGGGFWFFRPGNLELAVKILDGRPVNGHFWVFLGGLSNVAHTVTVLDTVSGRQEVYTNPQGRLTSRADTSAFEE